MLVLMPTSSHIEAYTNRPYWSSEPSLW